MARERHLLPRCPPQPSGGAGGAGPPVTLIYLGAALLVVAQALGIYALRTRKADLVFSVVMVGMVAVAVVAAGYGAYSHLS